MNVQVVDLKTGKLKTMSERYAKVLVKMKRACWPETQEKEVEADNGVQTQDRGDELDADREQKKRGRKPKAKE